MICAQSHGHKENHAPAPPLIRDWLLLWHASGGVSTHDHLKMES